MEQNLTTRIVESLPSEIQNTIDKLLAAPAPTVTNSATHSAASEIYKTAKKTVKEVDTYRLTITAPYRNKVAELNDAANKIISRLQSVEKSFFTALKKYENEQRQKERELQEQLRREHEAALLANAPAVRVEVVPAVEKPTIKSRVYKEVKIVDAAKIPREFLTPNIAAIEVELKAGRTVAGAVLVDRVVEF